MTISDRDRKVLWGRAGSRCALCRGELIRSDQIGAPGALIGQECHIVSPRNSGPRGGENPPTGEHDAYANLILLCANDHVMVDQRPEAYPVSRLLEVRTAHESWVRSRLDSSTARTRIRRELPERLPEVVDAGALIRIVAGAHESSLDHDELRSEAEVELVGGFLQSVFDAGEMWPEMEPAARVEAQYMLGRGLQELRIAGWRVFGERARGRLHSPDDVSAWVTAYVHVARADSPDVGGSI